jgi:3-oxoacyl-[acyl-carrier protein] reductase
MNIAGVMLSGWSYEQPPKEIDLQIDVNLKGVIWGTQTAAQHMMKNRRGHIVNIASLAGIAPIPGLSAYVASKYGVRGYTRAIASELFEHGIHVTVVCPDAIMTPLIEQSSRHEAGVLVFSGGRLLTLEEAGQIIIHRAIERREIEVAFPSSRAWLSHLASAVPWLGNFILPRLIRKGKMYQEEHVKTHQEPGGAVKQS